jgi:hypothetical protein
MPNFPLLRSVFLGIAFIVVGISCTNPANNKQKQTYFAWKEFLSKEITRLKASKTPIKKSIILNEKKEEKTLTQINFENELAMFLEADLNKPAFENSYDNLSEGNIIWYSLKKEENQKVKKLLIHLDNAEMPENVEIVIQEKNILFSTEKILHMHFTEGHLQTYSIEGKQQLAWLTPSAYQMMGVVLSK